MGFFASRKAETSPLPVKHEKTGFTGHPAKSVAQLLRNRLNGRKERTAKLGSLHSTDYTPSLDSTSDIPIHDPDHSNRVYGTGVEGVISQKTRPSDTNRKSTDAVTLTLAHKLNELAAANADGFLSDDDYRVLRQNLFKSFVAVSEPPTEVPIVKSVEPVPFRFPPASHGDYAASTTTRLTRAPSMRTTASNTSTISTLFQRVLRRSSETRSVRDQDQMSIASSSRPAPISPSMISVARGLSRQVSNSSLKSDVSRNMTSDIRSMSSKLSVRSIGTTSDAGGMTRRSTRSLRSCMPPPSSFNARHMASPLSLSDGNEDRLRPAEDIRAEIRATEAEEQSVLAALSILAQQPFNPAMPSFIHALDSRPGWPPPVPPKKSSPNTGQSTSPLGTSPASQDSTELDSSEYPVETQLAEIERRRAEITVRYQQRLDYLRARLKGAEIHERLLRK
ncbi:uncharacterized protein FOMMEDRAFT_171343 [Fomitiporia mediterranea MF3/22]|uniref:uncharacterized protein n=1 Tax=Fomitiporia mediterranea (strain MF3/22) TaxID=694068 RepID=UPI0004408E44|nr:uncharacterized protein FOMMEDRAFT_171343 [Fomitiporia mediterranea MF3/22]EJC97955.1 hypothetical protein FOMMEDRAFT_171343 [Fomitiporia mediterranea MF3/22]